MLKLLTLAEYANLKMMASQAPRAYLTCDGSINQSSWNWCHFTCLEVENPSPYSLYVHSKLVQKNGFASDLFTCLSLCSTCVQEDVKLCLGQSKGVGEAYQITPSYAWSCPNPFWIRSVPKVCTCLCASNGAMAAPCQDGEHASITLGDRLTHLMIPGSVALFDALLLCWGNL
jgi:hypothetical protein